MPPARFEIAVAAVHDRIDNGKRPKRATEDVSVLISHRFAKVIKSLVCCLALGSAWRASAQEPATAEELPAPAAESPAATAAADGGLAALMPARFNGYVELRNPAQLSRLLPLGVVGRDGPNLVDLLRLLDGATVALGVDTRAQDALLVIEWPDAAGARRLSKDDLQALDDLVRRLQAADGRDAAPPAVEGEGAGEAPGPVLRRFDPLAVAQVDRRWLIATRPELLPSAAAAARSEDSGILADDAAFRSAAAGIRADAPAWLFARPSALADLLTGEGPLMRASREFPLVSRMISGLLLPASGAPYLALELAEREGQPELSLVVPEELRNANGDLRLLIAALDQQAQADAPLLPEGTILSVSAAVNRDAVKLATSYLLDSERLTKLSETSPDAAALLEGLPMIEQILEHLEPQMQLIVARQRPANGERAQADLRLPAAAIVFQPRNAQEVKTAFITTYLGTIRNANLRAKAAGRPTLVLKSERRGDALVTGAVYRKLDDDVQPGRLEYNLSPSMAVIGSRFIIATNLELAQELADLSQREGAFDRGDSNLRVDVGPSAFVAAVAENLPILTQPRDGSLAGEATPLTDLAVDVLRRWSERAPDEPRQLTQRFPRLRLRLQKWAQDRAAEAPVATP